MREILLLDNGSRRPQSTLALRDLAARLAARLRQPVQPVSLAHSDLISADKLAGQPAITLETRLLDRLRQGVQRFLVIPLFFGPSGALTEAIPALAARLRADAGPLDVRLAAPLCPLPQGEPRLTAILLDRIATAARETQFQPRRLVLVDHGSPRPEVNAARRWVAADLRSRLAAGIQVEEAAMERRAGPQYDFNGELLLEVLRRLARADSQGPVFVAPLFLFAGRHAGPGGDLDEIAGAVKVEYPALRIALTGLVGDHPALLDILASRYQETLEAGA
ncbi:MAG: cobalamin biosynthesis protein CbiX [Chromatiaceae bacterium]|nr:cobalamin biosynthesis protein CbiX [Chromatiaceae bacterium]